MIVADLNDLNHISKILRETHRSAFPVAVRETLNNAAFDVKKNQLLAVEKELFIVRSPNFVKRFTKVDKAGGFKVNSMVAEVGLVGAETANFHEQEVGGTVKRVAIPTIDSRTGKNERRKIAKKHYLQNNSIIDNNKASRKRNRKSQYIADAYMAKKLGKWLFRGNGLYKVDSFKKVSRDRAAIKLTLLYSIDNNRKVKLKKTRYVELASLKEAKNISRYYKVAANRRLKKYYK